MSAIHTLRVPGCPRSDAPHREAVDVDVMPHVWSLQNQLTPWREDSSHLSEEGLRVEEVLDYIEASDSVESPIPER